MGLFKKLFSGLTQAADDDVNGLITVMIACLIDNGNYGKYRDWFADQIKANPSAEVATLGRGIFTDLTQQSADRERRGMREATDAVLWKIRQEEIAL